MVKIALERNRANHKVEMASESALPVPTRPQPTHPGSNVWLRRRNRDVGDRPFKAKVKS